MMKGLLITEQVHFRQGRGTRNVLEKGQAKTPDQPGRVPRLSRLMALAIHIHTGS
jgi:hypothetical protein